MIFFIWLFAEIYLFFKMTTWIGWGDTFLLYYGPSLLGILIVSSWSRMGLMTVQSALAKGEMPGPRLLHTAAIFLGGLCLAFPSATSRILAVFLILPGLRHLLVWRFQLFAAKKMASGSAKAFSFMQGKAGGFRFYSYSSRGGPFQQPSNEMRDVTPDQVVLDVPAQRITTSESESKPDSFDPRGRSDS